MASAVRATESASAPRTIPVARPRLPPAEAILPYLRQIDAAAWYSNHGPLTQLLQARLATHWGVEAPDVALLSSGTSALTLLLQASGARPGSLCLMPSWTFVASAGAVVAAGLIPYFVDVCPSTWVPDPAEMQALASRHDVGAMLVVSPFGAPLDLATWERVQRAAGVPVVIDGAAAFDTLRARGPMALGACPIIVSLHATKVFGLGEGGAVLSRDRALLQRVRRLAQFGFLGTREATLPGVNAKMSEYAAAIGLAGLDCWSEVRARWQAVTEYYCAELPIEFETVPGFGRDWVSSTLTVLCPVDRVDRASLLEAEGIGTLRWWGPGCHAQPAFKDCRSEPLPVTASFATRSLGLPFWQDMEFAQVEQVCTAAERCFDVGVKAKTSRMRATVTA